MKTNELISQHVAALVHGMGIEELKEFGFKGRKLTDLEAIDTSGADALALNLVTGRDYKNEKRTGVNLAKDIAARRKVVPYSDFIEDAFENANQKEFKKLTPKKSYEIEEFIKGLKFDYEQSRDFAAANEQIIRFLKAVKQNEKDIDLQKVVSANQHFLSYVYNTLQCFHFTSQDDYVAKLVGLSLFSHATLPVKSAQKVDEFAEKLIAQIAQKDTKYAIEDSVRAGAVMAAKLLWKIENVGTEGFAFLKAPQYKDLDDKYKFPEKYLHDVALFRKFAEVLLDVNHSYGRLENGVNSLSYVAYGKNVMGSIVNVFKDSFKSESSNPAGTKTSAALISDGDDVVSDLLPKSKLLMSKSLSPSVELMVAFAKNDGKTILKSLGGSGKKAKSLGIEDVVLSAFAMYCSQTDTKDAGDLAEALIDLQTEISNSSKVQKAILKDAVDTVAKQLQEDKQNLDALDLNQFPEQDRKYLEQVREGLHKFFENVYAPATSTISAPAKPIAVAPAAKPHKPTQPANPVRSKTSKADKKTAKYREDVLSLIKQILASGSYAGKEITIGPKSNTRKYKITDCEYAKTVLGAFLLTEEDMEFAPEGTKGILEEVRGLEAPDTVTEKSKEDAAEIILRNTKLIQKDRSQNKGNNGSDSEAE